MLALRALSDVLQQMALHLHARAFCSMVRLLNQTVKVVICDARVVTRACTRCSVNLLLMRHATVVGGRDLKAERALALTLILATGATSYVAAERRLSDLLLDQLLVLFVLLDVLLE